MTHVMDAAVDGVLLSLKLTDDSLAKERCFKGKEKKYQGTALKVPAFDMT